jgi:hypothetical protein
MFREAGSDSSIWSRLVLLPPASFTRTGLALSSTGCVEAANTVSFGLSMFCAECELLTAVYATSNANAIPAQYSLGDANFITYSCNYLDARTLNLLGRSIVENRPAVFRFASI